MTNKLPIVILDFETNGNYRAFYADTRYRQYVAEDDSGEVYPESIFDDSIEDVIKRRREH